MIIPVFWLKALPLRSLSERTVPDRLLLRARSVSGSSESITQWHSTITAWIQRFRSIGGNSTWLGANRSGAVRPVLVEPRTALNWAIRLAPRHTGSRERRTTETHIDRDRRALSP
jgi:hypothetical protein